MNLYDHVVAVIICILAPVLAFTTRQFSSTDIKLEPADKIRLYHSNGLLLIVFALVILTMWRIPDRPIAALGIDLITWHPLIPVFVAGILLLYAIDIFLQYGLRKKGEKNAEEQQRSLTFIPSDKKELFHFFFLVIAASIGEEIIFRGFLLNYLISWTGNSMAGIVAASIFSSILFAFLHGYQGTIQMIKIFFFAMLFCALFILTQSLILVIIVHALIDLISGFIGLYLVHPTTEDPEV
jgi:membrane protease YdiL (CAAX protease family)